jgi:hypothetical protein
MALKSNLVNLDAMIKREDFALTESEAAETYETIHGIGIRDFTSNGVIGIGSILRKPDFQRETNHWGPEQVVSLLECFVNGDLIPSVILWKSPAYLFVIDGGHRLSALKAWIEDDYGDGHISTAFFGQQLSTEQKKNANKVRLAVNNKVGSWAHFLAKYQDQNLDPVERKKVNTIATRSLPIQWVLGGADKAESSFFKINTKGTPLDEIEELLLKNRNKPIAIAARAIIRAGKGHKYWSSFKEKNINNIENVSSTLHTTLFDPEIKKPIKTLDLPLGGPKGLRTALATLIDLILIATRNQQGEPKKIETTGDDETGEGTIEVLKKALNLVSRVTGNDKGSLGLHPAVYFYGPTGRHSAPLFMGTMTLIARKLSENNKQFFKDFTEIRSKLEDVLIENKDLIATVLLKHISYKRVDVYANLIDKLIANLQDNIDIDQILIVKNADLEGKVIVGAPNTTKNVNFSDEIKSETFIKTALNTAIKCSICNGYLDIEKSVSYDHIMRVQDGGVGEAENCSLTHPYCNQSVKN